MTDTVPGLLAARLSADPAGPLVTFYDDDTGERTELSAATFANWVAKTANLIVDGLGLGAGDRAVVALPVHWQSLVVVAGCWAAGLEVRLAGAGAIGAGNVAAADVGFAAEGAPAPDAGEVVRLSLRPLGAGLLAPDPAATDYAAEVRSYGDRFTGPPPAPTAPALDGRSQGELAGSGAEPRRVLLAPDGDPLLDHRLLEAAFVAPISGGGSVVLVRHADRSLLGRRADSERAAALPD